MSELSPATTKAVIWDMDGTLLDSFGIYQAVLGEALDEHGMRLPSDAVLAHNFHGSLEDSINNALGGVSPEKLEQIINHFLAVQNKHYEVIEQHIFPDALGLAQRTHALGIRQIIVTNRNHEGRMLASPRSIVERTALHSLIDLVISGDDSEHRKPKPEVLGDFFAESGLNPTDIMVIGDQHVDADFALNIGSPGIIVNRNGTGIAHAEKLPEDWQRTIQVVQSLDEIA